MTKEKIVVEAIDAQMRLDRYLAHRYPDLSRAKWLELVAEGRVLVNGKPSKPSLKLLEGMEIEFALLFSEHQVQDFSFQVPPFCGTAPEVVFEDEDILVLAKGTELSVHPGAGLGIEKTLLGWAVDTQRICAHGNWSADALNEHRPGVVHRLDKATSGLLVMAKNGQASENLSKQFKEHTAQRIYWAVVNAPLSFLDSQALKGPIRRASEKASSKFAFKRSEEEVFTLLCFLERDPRDKTKYRVDLKGDGRRSVTHFVCSSRTERHALLELKLDTGRTHQIRVHLRFLGHAILGDEAYGGEKFRRLMLHAHRLSFRHPKSGKELSFEQAWPAEDLEWMREHNLKLQTVEASHRTWPALKLD